MSNELLKQKILRKLEEDSRLDAKTLSILLDAPEEEIRSIVEECEKDGTILSYMAKINWEKTEQKMVRAIIELKTTPQRDRGFGAIAERIAQFPEVKSAYLMSGGFDLALTVEGETMRDVALFVAEKLATMDGVTSTATHFVLQTYKEDEIVFTKETTDKRGNTW